MECKDLVFVKTRKAKTNSLKVAEFFKKPHDRLLENIRKLTLENVRVKSMFKKSIYINSRGRELPVYEMDRDGFTILVMGFTGKKALDFKVSYIDAFNVMEKMLLQKTNAEWIENRERGKIQRLELTDTIQEFVDYATDQGSQNAQYYYSTLTKETYKALKLISKSEKVPTGFRDKLPIHDTSHLILCEEKARRALNYGMKEELHYKEIYQLAKIEVMNTADSLGGVLLLEVEK